MICPSYFLFIPFPNFYCSEFFKLFLILYLPRKLYKILVSLDRRFTTNICIPTLHYHTVWYCSWISYTFSLLLKTRTILTLYDVFLFLLFLHLYKLQHWYKIMSNRSWWNLLNIIAISLLSVFLKFHTFEFGIGKPYWLQLENCLNTAR